MSAHRPREEHAAGEAVHPDPPDGGSIDAAEHRRASVEHWDAAAPGWVRRQAQIREFGAPVSHWMMQAIDPQPGQRVLELAAGVGETGFLAAELVAPVGGVIVSDQSEAMLDGARTRAAELALTNVEFQGFGAEWIDLPVASVDCALCRWGYMLMADPLAALLETRRVLRPGGRLALAVWDALERNPWAQLPALELRERGLVPPVPDGAPGPFALDSPERIAALLAQAGFTEILVDSVAVAQEPPSFDAFWEATLDLSRNFHDAVLARAPQEVEQIRAAIAARLRPYTNEDGSLQIPGRSLVAVASA
jgi:SAM-dependent methyltransferase